MVAGPPTTSRPATRSCWRRTRAWRWCSTTSISTSTYPEAHAEAQALLGDHIGGVDLHANVPDDPTQAGGGTLTESARYGLAMAALGELAHAIAEASGVSANVVNALTLTRALSDDLGSSEALFDGMGPRGALSIGSCPVPDTCTDSACSTVCDIGPRTVRQDLANQLEAFVNSTANATGLGTTDISEMKAHIAKDAEPELFGDAPVPGDGPTLDAQRQRLLRRSGHWHLVEPIGRPQPRRDR